MADLATLNARLTEAEDAKHQLALGQSVVKVMRDGRQIEYGKSDAGTLGNYIRDMQKQIADLEADAAGESRPRRRAISVAFR